MSRRRSPGRALRGAFRNPSESFRRAFEASKRPFIDFKKFQFLSQIEDYQWLTGELKGKNRRPRRWADRAARRRGARSPARPIAYSLRPRPSQFSPFITRDFLPRGVRSRLHERHAQPARRLLEQRTYGEPYSSDCQDKMSIFFCDSQAGLGEWRVYRSLFGAHRRGILGRIKPRERCVQMDECLSEVRGVVGRFQSRRQSPRAAR